jgi:hypothetical protein
MAERCDFEFDGYIVTQCQAPARYSVRRADGDETFSGGKDDGVYYACPAHVPEALFDMASGEDVHLDVALHYDEPAESGGPMTEPNWATPQDAYRALLDRQVFGTSYAIRGEDGFDRRVPPEVVSTGPRSVAGALVDVRAVELANKAQSDG